MHRLFQRWFRQSRAQDAVSPSFRLGPYPSPGPQALATQPLLILDLETTGLDLQHDQVLSAGAIRIEELGIVLNKSYERVFRIETDLPRGSQLFHGLTTADLAAGDDPREALWALLTLGQDALWLAWHGWFDQHMLHKGARRWLGLTADALPCVLDLAKMAPVLFPEHATRHSDLNHWLHCFGLDATERHHATADAMATAELALICLHRAQAQGLHTWQALVEHVSQRQQALTRREQATWNGL